MKVMTIVGTRPEIIRLARVVIRLDECVEHVLVHTGQNYDYTLNEVFFEDLELRAPDHYLGVDTSTLGSVLGGTIIAVERVLLEEMPDAVLILGDTNSSVAALIAKRMRIPVYHMEAGNRSFDENVPEEINRRMVDHISDFNLVYTEHARRNLIAEGLHPRRIMMTGSPIREVVDHFRDRIDGSDVLGRLSLTAGNYFLVSAHREENVDSPPRLEMLLNSLLAVRREWGYRVIVSTHPRTRKRIKALSGLIDEGIEFMDPFGFHDYNHLQLHAACVLSDSGTISEESAILGFPAVTIRDSMERPEALDAGAILLTGLDRRDVVRNVRVAMSAHDEGARSMPAGYEVADASRRVVNFMLSTITSHHAWAGIRRS